MHIDHSEFGSITIDGKTYRHDVTMGLSGHVKKRHNSLSKDIYGTSHVISEAEAKEVFEKGSELLIVGSGQEGNLRLSQEAENYLVKEGCEVLVQPTQEAIKTFNRRHGHKIALIHVTC